MFAKKIAGALVVFLAICNGVPVHAMERLSKTIEAWRHRKSKSEKETKETAVKNPIYQATSTETGLPTNGRSRSKSRSLTRDDTTFILAARIAQLKGQEAMEPSQKPTNKRRSNTIVEPSTSSSFPKLQRHDSELVMAFKIRQRKATDKLIELLFNKTVPLEQVSAELTVLIEQENADVNDLDADEDTIIMRLIKEIAKCKDAWLREEEKKKIHYKVEVLNKFLELSRCAIDWEHTNVFGQTIDTLIAIEAANKNPYLNFLGFHIKDKKPSEQTMKQYKKHQATKTPEFTITNLEAADLLPK